MSLPILSDRLQRIVQAVFSSSNNAAAIAARMGPSTFHRIVSGDVGSPRLDTVRELAEAFGVPMAWLTGDESTEQSREAANFASDSEAEWLIWSHHRRRQAAARRALLAAKGQRRAQAISRNISGLDLRPSEKISSLQSISELLESLGPASPERRRIVLQLAQLETEIIETTHRKLLEIADQ